MNCSRMFGHKVKTLQELECATAEYTQLAEEKLYKQGSAARFVTVYVTSDGWQMMRKQLNPCYTTRLRDSLRI
ncbi:hypothetical protein [uncultured Treponema sp.]|uniref:DinB/UmuC family translesion DNA polymerase n=1 Tax=uncultured Treponema sp. TaxID=162155 RepID=UPI00338FCF17